MIEGLKVTIAGTELKALCESRASFHDGRASFYAQQKESLPDIDETVLSFSNVSKRPEDMMEERIKSHKSEAAELRFIANHLSLEESYLLCQSDLHKLGIMQRGY